MIKSASDFAQELLCGLPDSIYGHCALFVAKVVSTPTTISDGRLLSYWDFCMWDTHGHLCRYLPQTDTSPQRHHHHRKRLGYGVPLSDDHAKCLACVRVRGLWKVYFHMWLSLSSATIYHGLFRIKFPSYYRKECGLCGQMCCCSLVARTVLAFHMVYTI